MTSTIINKTGEEIGRDLTFEKDGKKYYLRLDLRKDKQMVFVDRLLQDNDAD